MDGLSVDVGGEAAGGRENGNSKAGSHVHSKHRRSKSATDRNLDKSRGGVSQPIQCGYNESHELPHLLPRSERTCGARSPLHESSISTNTDTESSHRASLEKDIEKLQVRLQQEKCMRMMLERAMGRASSTLSPGHRHFSSQTKDLIAELELLEEEIVNREQHVLSLYRSIFEQCVSRPPSEQSSVMASPAHTKNESRKHPTIISSSFCSSKKFPLGPFHALVYSNDLGKRTLPLQSKTRRASLLSGKDNHHIEKTRSNHGKVQEILPAMEKTSMLPTLKDHLYQCPTKLSEEMVRCMAAVYCWLRNSGSSNIDQNRSPLLSRSSTNVVLSRRGISDERDKSCKSVIEISSISTDKNHFSRASYAINNYRFLVEQLEKVSVTQMETDAKIAFWINTYNSLVMHAYLAYGIPHNSLRRLSLFQKDVRKLKEFWFGSSFFILHTSITVMLPTLWVWWNKAAYKINGHIVSANAIEQAIFCFHTPRVGRWFEIILATAMRKRFGEEKQLISSKFGLRNSPSLVYFALCTGAFSDPVLRVYTASNVQEELEVAKREFLLANVVVKKSKKVFLPKVLERFAKEASISSDDLIAWVAENVDKKIRESIQNCIDRKTSKKASQVVEWLPYDSKFRYVFSKGLAEKPWWV